MTILRFPRAARALMALLVAAPLAGSLSACNLDLTNPNAATEDDVLNTRAGLIAYAVGLQRLYNVQSVDDLVLTTAITSRELAVNNTFVNLVELEAGGAGFDANNANITNLFRQMNTVIGASDDLIAGASAVEGVEPELRSGLVALGHFYKAAAIGALAQSFTHVATANDPTGQATYKTRTEAFAEAVQLLQDAEALLAQTPPNAAFQAIIPSGFDLTASVRAYLARYALFAGNPQLAIDASNRVGAATSVFRYSDLATNPIYSAFYVGTPSYAVRDNLGLPAVEAGDARLAFYATPREATSNPNGLPIETAAGFADDGLTAGYPVFLPGEMALIRAEAYLRLPSPNLGQAVTEINAVRTKTAAADPFGVGAGLPAYSGPVSEDALLEEIFYQRAMELYLQGLRLEDARRLGRPGPSSDTFQRNRNFYPFPQQERLSNPNTPADPSI